MLSASVVVLSAGLFKSGVWWSWGNQAHVCPLEPAVALTTKPKDQSMIRLSVDKRGYLYLCLNSSEIGRTTTNREPF